MPRDNSGNYTLPAGNPVIAGTVIEDTWANPTMNDLGAALTDSLSRSGKGGMLAPFFNADGLKTAPGISWISEITSGWYRAGAGDFRYSVQGQDVFRISNGTVYRWVTDQWEELATSAGSTTWGNINGTLSDQLDLQAALDTKLEVVNWGIIGGTLSDQADLQAALDAKLSSVLQDTNPTLGGALNLNGFGLGSVLTTTVGDDFVVGDIGTIIAAGTVSLAQADDESSTKGELVMALEPISGGVPGSFMELGLVKGLVGLMAGTVYYLDATTPGKFTSTPPSGSGQFVRVIGYTRGVGTEIAFKPGDTWIKLL